jgi:DNA-binding NarL/FixJ family response regulator
VKRCLLISESSRDLWLGALRSGLSELDSELALIARSEIARTHQGDYDLVIVDAAVTNDLRSLISAIRARDPAVRIVVFSSVDDWRRAREAMLAGAVDYTLKSLDQSQIVGTLKRDLLQSVPPVPATSEVSGG